MKELYWKAIWRAAGGEPDTDDVTVRGDAIQRGRRAIEAMSPLALLELISDLFDEDQPK